MQRYRSGHNGADSKSVCRKLHVGSNPTRCAKVGHFPRKQGVPMWHALLVFTGQNFLKEVLLCVIMK